MNNKKKIAAIAIFKFAIDKNESTTFMTLNTPTPMDSLINNRENYLIITVRAERPYNSDERST